MLSEKKFDPDHMEAGNTGAQNVLSSGTSSFPFLERISDDRNGYC